MVGGRAHHPPRRGAHVSVPVLAIAALVAIGAWMALESQGRALTHPLYVRMVDAARAMETAARIIQVRKAAHGIMQPASIDPHRTGLIGPEFSPITTTLGDLEAKRTATNPDLAAALVRVLSTLGLRRGDVAVIVVSGSLVGANVAALTAAEALGLKPVVVASLAASMYGATDPIFTWADMERELRAAGVISSRASLLVEGGVGATARDLGPDGRGFLRAAAARHGGRLIDAAPFAALYRTLVAGIEREVGAIEDVRVLINAGGAQIALGTCPEAATYPNGLIRHPLPCSGDVPGLLADFSRRGVPIVHLLNMRRLAADWGLPYDPPRPPVIGDNGRVYGASSASATGG